MNVVVLSGNATADPEVRYTAEGKTVTNLRIAHDEGPNTETIFIDVSCFDRLAEIVGERVRKGHKVVASGSLRQESWTAKDGTAKSKLSIRAVSVEFMVTSERKEEPTRPQTNEPTLPF
jgi:single-strand DNA-binding protein